MTELKPCPFCGEQAVADSTEHQPYSEFISCMGCTAIVDTPEQWNTRPSPWRSLKDELPPQSGDNIFVRDGKGANDVACWERNAKRWNTNASGLISEAELSEYWTEWCEVPS